MRPPANSIGLGIVAREMALELSEASFRPDIGAEHVPGQANKAADELSRLFQPGASGALPRGLLSHRRTPVAERRRSYFRSLVPPMAGGEAS